MKKKINLLSLFFSILVFTSCSGPKPMSIYSKIEYKNNSSIIEFHNPQLVKQANISGFILAIPVVGVGVFLGAKSGIEYGGLIGGASALFLYDMAILLGRATAKLPELTPQSFISAFVMKEEKNWQGDRMIFMNEKNDKGEKMYKYILKSAEHTFLFEETEDVYTFKKFFPNSDADFPLEMLSQSIKLSHGAFVHTLFTDRVRAVNSVYPNSRRTDEVNRQYEIMVKREIAAGTTAVIIGEKVFGRDNSPSRSIPECDDAFEPDPDCEGLECYYYTCHYSGKILRIEQVATNKYKIGAGSNVRYAETSSEARKIAQVMTSCNCN